MSDSYYVPIARHALHPMWRLRAAIRFIGTCLGPPLSVLVEQANQAVRIIPESWNKCLFRRFWGENVSSRGAYLVIDSYENVMLRNRFRWADSVHNQQGGFSGGVIQGTFSPQATAILTALFLRYTGKGLRITTDIEEANKNDGILICYGSPDSNFRAFEIEAQSEGALCQFAFDESGERGFRVGEHVYAIENRNGVTYDKAILLRLANQRDSNQCHIVCAGLSEWGSLAAVHFLTKRWKALHKRFDDFGKRRDFCVLLEVPYGQFEDARELASAVSWQSNPAHEMK